MDKLLERFLHYVSLDTQSKPGVRQVPSTEGQWKLLNLLKEQLEAMGLVDVTLSEKGTVMGTLPANIDGNIPAIGFISHVDTSPDFSGKHVNPQIVENYRGGDIALGIGDEVLSPVMFPVLHQHSPVDFHFSYSDFHLFPSCQTAVFPALPVSGYDSGSGALLSSPVPPSLIHGNIHCSCRPDGNCYAPYSHLPGFCPPLLSEDFCFPVSSVFSRKHRSQTQKTVLHPTF